ncbi:MAG: type II secretion system F family protein [Hyphomicrobiales bacterium]|nr:type II secretion system F family protein [Rhodoblastus sp.]MCB9997982.1 type II secretion system F family protein [Methylobacteriaceae bacterium]MCC2103930.1 type II secretion system F family protein [Hyphomicrobiales bacterium]HRY01926.1 type II secretion system F family protein [Beijerinckiaceae bacterium]MCB1523976.1 type II secretion system F family protein [Rhodoblastus sp.]
MIKQIYDKLSNPSTVVALLVAVAVIATILTIAMPLLDSDSLSKRMKSVASEREKIRARERERLAHRDKTVSLRTQPKAYMRQLVENFSLEKWLGTEEAKMQLTMAGFRGRQAEVAFLFFRAIAPIGLFVVTLLYMFLMFGSDMMVITKIGSAIAAAYLGLKAPELFLKNKISKRQASMRRAFPDSMDLILICVESGMSIEHAFRKVASEIGIQSIEMAEEFALTTAELSYLPDRRQAYENLGVRTGVDGLKQVSTVLIQAEKYGTPLGQALRVVAQEGRDARLLEAERKAAALPPKLTVPMIVFFLPVLFAVILTPALIQMSEKLM